MATLIIDVSGHTVSEFDYGLSEEGETTVSFWQNQNNTFFGLVTGAYRFFIRNHGGSSIIYQEDVEVQESLPLPYEDEITGPSTIAQSEHGKVKVSNVMVRDPTTGWTGGSYKVADNEDVFIDVPTGMTYEIRIS